MGRCFRAFGVLALGVLAGSAGWAPAQVPGRGPDPQLTCLPVPVPSARLQLGLEVGGDPFFWRQRLRRRNLEFRERFAPEARCGACDRFDTFHRFREFDRGGRFCCPAPRPYPYFGR